MKRLILVAFCIFTYILSYSQAAIAPRLGDGSKENPYQIESLQNIYWIATNPDSWKSSFLQTADIDARVTSTWTDGAWVSIGNDSIYFEGHYNGNDFTIEGLSITTTETDYQGLFGVISNGVLENISITNGKGVFKGHSGMLCGMADTSLIANCTVEAEIEGTGYYTAVLLGYSDTTEIINCSAKGSVTNSVGYVAGITPYAFRSTVRKCNAEVDIYASGHSSVLLGDCSKVTVDSCNASGIVKYTGSSSYQQGGMISYLYLSTVTNCFADVETHAGDYTSSFIAYATNCTIRNCISKGDCFGRSAIGGLIGYVYGCTIDNCHAFGDVVTLTAGGMGAGGFISNLSSSIVSNCSAHGDCQTSDSDGGGFIGRSSTSVISRSYSTGNVRNFNQNGTWIGGFVGTSNGDTISECYSLGNVYANGINSYYTGGFAGNFAGKLKSCFSLSNIYQNTNMYSQYIGGLVGILGVDSIVNCYSSGEVVGKWFYGGALGKVSAKYSKSIVWNTDATITEESYGETDSIVDVVGISSGEMKKKNNYQDWDFDNTWSIDENLSFPYLQSLPDIVFAFPDTLELQIQIGSNISDELKEILLANDYSPTIDKENFVVRWDTYYAHSIMKAQYQVGYMENADTIWSSRAFVVCSEPIEISSYDELCSIGTSSDYPMNGSYVLTNDIDASPSLMQNSGEGFMPIGSIENPFCGSFNGNYYSIENLNIDRDTLDNVGLFASTSNAIIENVSIINFNITGKNNVGVLVGKNSSSKILKCSVDNGICKGVQNIGGITGQNWAYVRYCSANGIIRGSRGVGGIVGTNEYAKGIWNCYSLGQIDAELQGGGIAGYVYYSTIENAYSYAEIQCDSLAGAIVGNNGNYSYNSIQQCFWDTELNPSIPALGIADSLAIVFGETTANMQNKSIYTSAGWDFLFEEENGTDDFWAISSDVNNGYPCFTWQLGVSNIELAEGLNFITISKEMDGMAIADVFAPIFEDLKLVKNNEGMFQTDIPDYLNSLTEVVAGEAYIVEMNDGITLHLPGNIINAEGASTVLKAGWNMVGFPLIESVNVENALAGIEPYVEVVKDFDGFYIPNGSTNSLSVLVSGHGYFIKVRQDCEILW